MLYSFTQFIIQSALYFFYKNRFVTNETLLKENGPLLITTNHPNAFIDAIIIATLFKKPMSFMTRGDVFKNPSIGRLLVRFNMIPVYRIRDGKENLHLNDYAFTKAHEVLKQNGIVLIFIEGNCNHTHNLQPLKKGAARIAFNCWNEGVDLKVLPASIRYSSLWQMPMNMEINVGNILYKTDLVIHDSEARNFVHFNEVVFGRLQLLLEHTNPSLLYKKASLSFLKYLACPIWYLIEKWLKKKTAKNVFYQSFLFAAFFILYPLYLILLTIIFVCLGIPTITILVIIPAIIFVHFLSVKY